jgi:putative ABC transport system permease protein
MFAMVAHHTSGIAASGGFAGSAVRIADGELSRELRAVRAHLGVLDVLGVRVAYGTAPKQRPAGTPTALLTWEGWQRLYGGAQSALGRTVRINGVEHTLEGVLPADFISPIANAEILLLMEETPDERDSNAAGSFGDHVMIAKLAPGATLEGVAAELETRLSTDMVMGPIAREVGLRLTPKPLRFYWVRDFAAVLSAIHVAALALLLVAVGNAMSLLVIRTWARRRDVAVHQCLGATGSDIWLRIAVEASLFALISAVIALPLIWLVKRALELRGIIPEWLPLQVGFDERDVGTAMMLGVAVAGVMATTAGGVVKIAASGSLALSARDQGESRIGNLFRTAVVGLQIVLSGVVLYVALLLNGYSAQEKPPFRNMGSQRSG